MYDLKNLGSKVAYCDLLAKRELPNQVYKLKTGTEARTVLRVGPYVYKFYDLGEYAKHKRKIELHNKLFEARTAYEIIGSVKDPETNTTQLVVRQPFIEFVPNSGDDARKQLAKDFAKRFGGDSVWIHSLEHYPSYGALEGDWYIKPKNLALDDLKNLNIGIDKQTGEYAVIDCIINESTYNRWKNGPGCGARSVKQLLY